MPFEIVLGVGHADLLQSVPFDWQWFSLEIINAVWATVHLSQQWMHRGPEFTD